MFPKLFTKYDREGVGFHLLFNMGKSVAILLLIIAFVGAEDKQAGQASSTSTPTKDAGIENLSAGGKMTFTLAGDSQIEQHHEENPQDSVSVKKEKAGVESEKEDHVNEVNEEGKEVKTKINEICGEEEKQAGQVGSTSTSTGESNTENENAESNISSSTASSDGTEAQQHHAVSPHELLSNNEDTAEVKTLEENKIIESSEETKTLKSKIHDETGKKEELWDVSMKCLDCLCYFATNCALKRQCEKPNSIFGLGIGFEKGDCGPFHISFPFWADANDEKMDIGDPKMENEWRLCSVDLICATKAIQKYFQKYPHDCNQDGKVDCIDYAAIHTLGPFGCMDREKLDYWNKYRRKEILQCLARKEEGAYTKEMEMLNKKLELQDIGARKLAEIEKNQSSDHVNAKMQTAEEKPEGKTNVKENDILEHIRGGIIQV